MTADLPSFNSVCQVVQREETQRKVMHIEPKSNSEARVFTSNHKHTGEKTFTGKKADWKCTYCNMKGHIREKCWILHLELKLKFDKEGRMIKEGKGIFPKALHSTSSLTGGLPNFTANPIDSGSFLQRRGGTTEEKEVISKNPTAMLGKFAGFLNETTTQDNVSSIISALSTALNEITHDCWIIDSGATDHITNKSSCLDKFQNMLESSLVSVANGKRKPIMGKGKLKLLSDEIELTTLYVPSFPFQLLSIGKLTNTLNCLAIFSPHNVVFQDRVTQKKIGEGFY
ncbi:hypothetical protein ACFX12_044080 [Malus domestica]